MSPTPTDSPLQPANDPLMAMVMQVVGKLMEDEPDATETASLDEVRQLKARITRMRRHIQRLERRNEFVASALGACGCWGASRGCPDCDGEGAPGTFQPDTTAYLTLVKPVFDMQREEALETPPAGPLPSSSPELQEPQRSIT